MSYLYSNSAANPITRATRSFVNLLSRGGSAWLVILASLLLSIISIAAIDVAETLDPTKSLGPIASRQVLYVVAGCIACAIVALPHYRKFGPWSWAAAAGVLVLLLFLLIPFIPSSIVRPRGGARSWIDLGPMDFQPSELAKLVYIVVLAWYLRYRRNHRTIKGLLPPAIITAIPVGLIMLQPDLGTALLFIPALFFVLIAAGAKLKHLVIVITIAILAAPAAYPLLKPHQKQRIVGLVSHWTSEDSERSRADELGINMQGLTAQRLIGAGRIAGTSDEHARALQRFNALPERHNDMVFSPIVTRFGLLGGVVVLALFALWMLGALWTAAACNEPFGRLMCVGACGFLFAQVMINLGMNMGLLPIIGITLPYVSHGGSSMLLQWLIAGLVLNVGLRRESFEYSKGWDEE